MTAIVLSLFPDSAPVAAALDAGTPGVARAPEPVRGARADQLRRVDPYDLALGGHTLVPCRHDPSYRGAPLWRCVRCHGIVPRWAITGPWLADMLGRHCRELVPALPSGRAS